MLLVFALTLLFADQSVMAASFGMITTIPVTPTNPTSFDIGWVDSASSRYYLADKTNTGVDVINALTNTLITTIHGFAGANGILVVPGSHQLWVGDNDGTTKVVDLTTNTIIHTTPKLGTMRADELAYDPVNNLILMAYDRDTPPFIVFISTTTFAIMGTISYPQSTAGIEQSVWNPSNNEFYLNLPATTANPGGEVDMIDPSTMSIIHVFPVTNCNPAGLALGLTNNLLLGCSGTPITSGAGANTVIMNALTGGIIKTITQVGGSDEVWFNPGDNRFYLAASSMTSNGLSSGTPTPVLGVIDASTNTWLFNIPTSVGAHSVAADSANNHVFVPLRTGASPLPGAGIGVYGVIPGQVGVPEFGSFYVVMALGVVALFALRYTSARRPMVAPATA